MVNRSADNRLHESLVQANLRARAGLDVYGLDDVLGFDYHRGDLTAGDFVFRPAR